MTVVALDLLVTEPQDFADDHDPEVAFERTQQQLMLLRLAREKLSDRERTVFFGIHFDSATRAGIAEQVGLSTAGSGSVPQDRQGAVRRGPGRP